MFLDKIIVHVRDPRQAILSWTHHIRELYENDDYALYNCDPPIKKTYFRKTFREQVDWQINNYFPHFLNWIIEWSKTEKSDFDTKIMITQYEDLRKNSYTFFQSILNFYNINLSEKYLKQSLIEPKKGKLHYRKGSLDEWRDVFTSNQIEKTTKAIPKVLFEEFGWEK
jgi:hypothetical protein